MVEAGVFLTGADLGTSEADFAPRRGDTGATHPVLQLVDGVGIGAGFAGLYALYRLREAGWSVRVFERGDGVGDTWYWNRYPGARVDIQSVEYMFTKFLDLEPEWDWTELMPAQAEIERYLNRVTDIARSWWRRPGACRRRSSRPSPASQLSPVTACTRTGSPRTATTSPVNDPRTAEDLVPHYPFGCKRAEEEGWRRSVPVVGGWRVIEEA